MKVTIDMDYDITDAVVKTELKWHREFVKTELQALKKKKKLEPYQKEDKKLFEKLLPALNTVCDYFGVKK